MTSRRSFVKKSLGIAGPLSLSAYGARALSENVADALLQLSRISSDEAANDEELWARLAQAYTVSASILNLNNGGVSPQPKVVQDAVDRYYHLSNEAPTYYMWQILDKGREPVRRKLADLAGTSPEEIAINRNTTEGLATVTWGLTLAKGDEVVMTKQDYPNMIHAWKQKELRDGVVLKWLSFNLPLENDDEVLKAFVDATTNKTRIWHITHMINWTGQILPVKKLCDEARKRNIISIVDGSHTFAHLDFKVTDFKPDYFGTSLHKWLCAPFGTGMLYVKQDNIASLWPLFPNDKPQANDIRKFEVLGTRSFAPEQAIGQAIDFHHAIGSKRKEARLHFLKTYWCQKVMKHSRVKLNVSLKPEYSCALGNFSIDGIEPEVVASRLFSEYQIHTSAIKWENISGVRITPHVYTTTKDLDRLVDAVLKIAAS
ncbi:MAG TPA: aminotransferase class V-fold PLP-dependent enzyme [Chryseolinea sp.]